MVNYKQVLSFKDEVMSSERLLLHMSKSRKHTDDSDFHVGVVFLHPHQQLFCFVSFSFLLCF